MKEYLDNKEDLDVGTSRTVHSGRINSHIQAGPIDLEALRSLGQIGTGTLHLLPTDAKERKNVPLWSGLVRYFPDALVAIARVSKAGNDQHNPGQPLHWSREKSADHEDTLLRHLFDSGSTDVDGYRHSAKMAWRALAILQLEIEKERRDSYSSGTSAGVPRSGEETVRGDGYLQRL